MKAAYKGMTFFTSQLELQSQMNMEAAESSRQIVKQLQERSMLLLVAITCLLCIFFVKICWFFRFAAKMEQAHCAVQKVLKQNQLLLKEKEALAKDISELQQKYSEKAKYGCRKLCFSLSF